jgi:hypothetical protein
MVQNMTPLLEIIEQMPLPKYVNIWREEEKINPLLMPILMHEWMSL